MSKKPNNPASKKTGNATKVAGSEAVSSVDAASDTSAAVTDGTKKGASRLLIAVVLLAAVAFFLFLLVNVNNATKAENPLPAVMSYASPGDHARAEIAGLLARGQQAIDLDNLYTKAEQFRADGAMADAYILYFYAARDGHGPSAFRLGMMSDPAYHDAYRDVMAEPDLFQSLKWYRVSKAAGVEEANAALDKLATLIRQRAADGDAQARRLLLEIE